MKTEHTLRYLLLRHLERFETLVERKRYLAVTRSLHVTVDGRDEYEVTWNDLDGPHSERFSFSAFRFYERGDTRVDSRTLADDLSNRNDALAAAFASEAFGVSAASIRAPDEPLEARRSWGVVELASFALGVGWLGGFGVLGTPLLLVLVLGEFVERGRLVVSVLLVVLALAYPSWAVVFGAGAYGLLQFLDPNPVTRTGRTALCAAALMVGIGFAAAPIWGIAETIVLALAFVLSAFRSFFTPHFRALPLSLPFFCAGLMADGKSTAAVLGLAVLAAGTAVIVLGHRWLPVRR